MTIKEFLNELEYELRYLNPKEQYNVVKFYQDKINVKTDYKEKEEHIINSLPSPKQIAKEIYESHGEGFLDIRKKRAIKKEKFRAAFEVFLAVLVLIAFLGIGIFYFNIIKNLVLFLSKISYLTTVFDKVIMIIFSSAYILLLMVVAIYLIDLFYIIIVMLLNRFFIIIKKPIKDNVLNFTLTGKIAAITKSKKLQRNSFFVLIAIMVITFISSFAAKGYVYRSINNIGQNEETITLDDSFEDISLEGQASFIQFIQTGEVSKVTLKYIYEFNKNYEVKIADNSILISSKQIISYDPLLFLKEPSPRLIVYLPSNFMINDANITSANGEIDFQNLNIKSLKVNIDTGFITLSNNVIEKLEIDSYNGDYSSKSNKITSAKISLKTGKTVSAEDMIETLEVENGSGNYYAEKMKISTFNFTNTSGTVLMKDIKGKEIIYKSQTSVNKLFDFNYKKMDLKIIGTCNLQLTRFVLEEQFVASVEGSYLTVNYLKVPSIEIKNKVSSVFLYYINKNHNLLEEKEENNYANTLINDYNRVKFDTTLNLTGNNVKTYISECDLLKANIDVETGALELGDVYLKEKLDIKLNTINLEMADIYAKEISLLLKKSDVTFQNSRPTEDMKFFVEKDLISQIDSNVERSEK